MGEGRAASRRGATAIVSGSATTGETEIETSSEIEIETESLSEIEVETSAGGWGGEEDAMAAGATPAGEMAGEMVGMRGAASARLRPSRPR